MTSERHRVFGRLPLTMGAILPLAGCPTNSEDVQITPGLKAFTGARIIDGTGQVPIEAGVLIVRDSEIVLDINPMAAINPMAEKRMIGKHPCTARSKQTGQRCRQPAIPGGNVCRYHGGAAPQVQQAARLRLAALVDPALDQLATLLKDGEHPSVALSAVKDVLDRNGLKAPERIDATVQAEVIPLENLKHMSTDELETARTLFRKMLGAGNN